MQILKGLDVYRKIVVIADSAFISESDDLSNRRDLEKTSKSTMKSIMSAIEELELSLVHYETPDELADNAEKHKNDLVLSIYGGESSRNRMALVPAICETFKLKHIGPDVYGRIIAQDKEVSKRLALDADLLTPHWLVIRDEGDIPEINSLSTPLVIKPLMEGSSIGISKDSLCQTHQDTVDRTRIMLEKFEQPVLVEEFIPGKEAALSVIESDDGFKWAFSEIYIPSSPERFSHALFDVEEKSRPTDGRTVKNIDNLISDCDLVSIFKFLRSFGHFGYCRVDGKYYNGRFYFLELTPDAWLDKKGQFSMAFTEKGWTYAEVIKCLLLSSELNPLNQLTND